MASTPARNLAVPCGGREKRNKIRPRRDSAERQGAACQVDEPEGIRLSRKETREFVIHDVYLERSLKSEKGVVMAIVPWRRSEERSLAERDPFSYLRNQINRVFDDFWGE